MDPVALNPDANPLQMQVQLWGLKQAMKTEAQTTAALLQTMPQAGSVQRVSAPAADGGAAPGAVLNIEA